MVPEQVILNTSTICVVVSLLFLLGHIVHQRGFVKEKFCVVGNNWIYLTISKTLLSTVLIVNCLVLLAHIMSFSVDEFAASPRLATLSSLKKAELMSLATYYKLDISTGARKADVRKTNLVGEELVSEDDDETSTDLELKKLEYQERERERANQLRLKELELKERELSLQLKIKELELAGTASSSSKTDKFDMSKQIRFVPPFQDAEVDKYFLHFEKVASSLEWPKEVWTLLLQSTLIGKAREVYSALSVDQSSNYEVVKGAILKAYELVPEAYCQQFHGCRKEESQKFVEFARNKENLFDRWCSSKDVNKEFSKLRQLMLLEEFKNCLPSDIKTHLDERKAEDLHQAAVWADDYALTHKGSFKKQLPPSGYNSSRTFPTGDR